LGHVEQPHESLFFFFNLCRAIGLLRVPWPENPTYPTNLQKQETNASVEDLLLQLDDYFGFTIDFPTVFNEECGYPTSRGWMNIRTAHSLYFIHRIKTILGSRLRGSNILEIGSGVGRNAYYLKKMGIKTITLVDIPIPRLVSSYWLGNVMGADSICLSDETPREHSTVFTLPTHRYQPCPTRPKYDLIVQCDGLTEYGLSNAQKYMDQFPDMGDLFFSINHDDNPYTVRELYKNNPRIQLPQRFPSWYRPGYIEELLTTVRE
jgi:hypothetical protein